MNFPRNLLSWTDEGVTFPEYVNINAEGGKVEITLRGAARGNMCGPTVTVPLGRREFTALVDKMVIELKRMQP